MSWYWNEGSQRLGCIVKTMHNSYTFCVVDSVSPLKEPAMVVWDADKSQEETLPIIPKGFEKLDYIDIRYYLPRALKTQVNVEEGQDG